MFTQEELQVIAQALANANVQVGQAKFAVEVLEKVVALLQPEEPTKKEK